MPQNDGPEDLDEALFYLIGITLASMNVVSNDLPYRRAALGFLLDHMNDRDERHRAVTDVLRTMLEVKA